MDAAATIRSRKMRHLFESGYIQLYAYVEVCVHTHYCLHIILCEPSGRSTTSMYKTVWTPQKAGDIFGHILCEPL